MSDAVTGEPAGEVRLSRVEVKRQRKIHDILYATADVLSERGYHALSLEDVAEKVDLTKATLYHYFASKEDLVSDCIRTTGTEVNARFKVLADSLTDADPREKLRVLLAARLEVFVYDFPGVARLFAQPLDWPPELRSLVRDLRHEHEAVFRAVVLDGVASGVFRDDLDPELALHCLFGATNHVPAAIRGRSRLAVRRQFPVLVEHLIRIVE